jgi:hypothetical protein
MGLAVLSLGALPSCGGAGPGRAPGRGEGVPPNILLVIMDDVGIDQMRVFGYGGPTPPSMPNMNAVAGAGVRFRNAWSMPECSPGRAAMLVGRYPLRTQVFQAIGRNDLANSQVSPYEVTVPRLLKAASYDSALFGKFHLAGPEHNEAGNGTPGALGWDYFQGWVGGLPASIDTTAGGIAPVGTYACGFVPGADQGGADTGACRFADQSCGEIRGPSPSGDAPGKQCLARGGIFVPNGSCQGAPPPGLDFARENAYYVSPLVINGPAGVETVPLSSGRARGYRTTIEVDAAIEWIKSRPASRPWMATVSFSAAHTPFQPAPNALAPATGTGALDCAKAADQRVLQNQMTEAMDSEFGRLLVQTGLARRNPDGTLAYDPRAQPTMVVIAGDNGTFGNSVKPPFNPGRSKGTAYQTGVWVPLIVAGPLVNEPNREVEHMVNMVDVFQLFGEIAGIDVHRAVRRPLDSASLLLYLADARARSVRTTNFAQSGFNLQVGGGRNGPCVIAGRTCSQIPDSRSVCEDNGGVWWGAGAVDRAVLDGSAGYESCCQVNQALYKAGRGQLVISPEISIAIRNDEYKLVQNTTQSYDPARDSCSSVVTDELYAVDQAVPVPKLDNEDADLLRQPLSPALQATYRNLRDELDDLLASQPACPGDGNGDRVVDGIDVANWRGITLGWGLSSVYDFDLDGLTDGADGKVIVRHHGRCPSP